MLGGMRVVFFTDCPMYQMEDMEVMVVIVSRQIFPHHIMLTEVILQTIRIVSVLKEIYTGYLTKDCQAF